MTNFLSEPVLNNDDYVIHKLTNDDNNIYKVNDCVYVFRTK